MSHLCVSVVYCGTKYQRVSLMVESEPLQCLTSVLLKPTGPTNRSSTILRQHRLFLSHYTNQRKLPPRFILLPTGPSGAVRDRVSMSPLSVAADSAANASCDDGQRNRRLVYPHSTVARCPRASSTHAEIKRFHSSHSHTDYPSCWSECLKITCDAGCSCCGRC